MNRRTRELILSVLSEWQDKAGYFQKSNLGNLVNSMALRYGNHQNLRSAIYLTLTLVQEPNGLSIPAKDRESIENEIINRVGQSNEIDRN